MVRESKRHHVIRWNVRRISPHAPTDHSFRQHYCGPGPTPRGTAGDFGLADLTHQYGHGLDHAAHATRLGHVAANRDPARGARPVAPHWPHAFSEHQLSRGDGLSAGT